MRLCRPSDWNSADSTTQLCFVCSNFLSTRIYSTFEEKFEMPSLTLTLPNQSLHKETAKRTQSQC